jgi:HEAT repeat protein
MLLRIGPVPLPVLPALLLLASVAGAHGGSFAPPFVPTGGPTDPDTDPRGGEKTPAVTTPLEHDWRTWWGYHREFFFARAMHGPASGARPETQGRLPRKRLREEILLPLLRQALEDKEYEVRSAAAVALGKLGAKEFEEELFRHDSRPPEGHHHVREGAIYGLSVLGDPALRLRMRNLAGDRERPFRERSLALLGLALDRSDESFDLLVAFQRYEHRGAGQRGDRVPNDGEEEKRRAATHFLAWSGRKDIEPLLWGIASDPARHGWPAAGLAVTGLARVGARNRIDDLFGMLESRRTEWEVRRSAAIALGLLLAPGEEERLRRLGKAAREQRDDPTRHFAVMALGAVGGPAAGDVLFDLWRSRIFPDARERSFLYLALGIAAPTSKPAGEALLEDYREEGNLELRGVQALALGIARSAEGLELTLERVRKGSAGAGGGEEFFRDAALGLGFHKDRKSLDALRDILRRYGHRSIRESAALSIALLGGRHAAGELVEMIRSGNSVADAAGAVAALGLIPDPPDEAIEALIETYRADRIPGETRAAAIAALGAIADDLAVPFSARLVANYNYFIRCLALDEIATYL